MKGSPCLFDFRVLKKRHPTVEAVDRQQKNVSTFTPADYLTTIEAVGPIRREIAQSNSGRPGQLQSNLEDAPDPCLERPSTLFALTPSTTAPEIDRSFRSR